MRKRRDDATEEVIQMAKNDAEVLEVEDEELVDLVEDDEVEGDEDETTLSTKDVAKHVGTTPKTLRRFLRARATAAGGTVGKDTPGQGGRYAFSPDQVDEIKAQFDEWASAKAAAAAARKEAEAEIAETDDSLIEDETEELLEDLV